MAADVRSKTMHQAVCFHHRWYGGWKSSRGAADRERLEHDDTCVPEREHWSPEAAALWPVAQRVAARAENVTLDLRGLRSLTNEQLVATLAGVVNMQPAPSDPSVCEGATPPERGAG